jgi:hypothetical protein
MTRFDDTNNSFKNALESSGTHSPKLLEEAMNIHTSRDLKTTENKIANGYPNNEAEAMRVHLAFLGAAKSDVAKADPKLQASIYRDLAVQDQGIVAAKMKGSDLFGAEMILNGRRDDAGTAKNLISKVENLDPHNKDLKQLHTIQEQLTSQLKSTEISSSLVGQLDSDALGAAVATSVDNSWNKAMNGSVQGAAEVQQFVDRAAAGGENEMLAKVYQNLDPHVAEQVKKAIQKHETITFE